ncbi:MAG: NYN domain-containing protein [Candidatus Gracilibacteria bacterium]|nr:NYN domain-containing protein [Candidatus Gracilibacteria bacterium]MDD2908177.1 NYN domain-containing protein [Candidatus Gracilibacteria bacterium]
MKLTKTNMVENNYAYIDAQNVNISIQSQKWKLDRKKFRIYLTEKYKVTRAYMFIGYIPENQDMYTFFQELGYVLIFKSVLTLHDGETKGNVDAELVLQAMIDYNKYSKAVIVTGDGDFACLINYLYKNEKLLTLIVPNERRYSIFLKNTAKEKLDSLTNLRKKLQYRVYKKRSHQLSTNT